MVLLPKDPIYKPPYQIYRGNDPEFRQYPILKTADYIEDLGPLSSKLGFAFKSGLKLGLFWSAYDIIMIMNIKERKAQIARCAYFTVPMVSASVGWMGGLEIAKKMLGRDRYLEAHVLGAAVPAAVWSIWRRNSLSFISSWLVFSLIGTTYQYGVDHNMYMSVWGYSHHNPNEPQGIFDQNQSMVGEVTRREFWRTPWLKQLDGGASWKKWEEKAAAE